MAVVSSIQCFCLLHVKFLLVHKNVVMAKFSFESYWLANSTQLGYFLFYCPLVGGYFSSVDLEMGVRIHLQEVAT